jgi:hypothetical protein
MAKLFANEFKEGSDCFPKPHFSIDRDPNLVKTGGVMYHAALLTNNLGIFGASLNENVQRKTG